MDVAMGYFCTMPDRYLTLLIILALCFLFSDLSLAQCPMCKASVESSMKEGSNAALGLNRGILYLLSMPYLIFCVLFLLWYRNWRQMKKLGIRN